MLLRFPRDLPERNSIVDQKSMDLNLIISWTEIYVNLGLQVGIGEIMNISR